MMRLNPEGYLRFVQADRFTATYAGAEASVAVSLCNYGKEATFVTSLPNNEIGQSAINSLRRYGVDTSEIRREGNRIGIYFLEKGASQRPSKVIYDRAFSAFAEAKPGSFDWKEIFKDACWFHFTGITPALSDSVAALTLEAVKAAKEMGVTVSCDLNYRSKLWSREKAREVMSELAKYVDVCIGNEEDANDVFGIKAADTDVISGTLSEAGYRQVAEEMAAKFGFSYVAFTLRESISANDNNWSALLYDCKSKTCHFGKKYPVHIVDRVGGGDSFAAGLIYGISTGMEAQDAIEFAVAASCLKHSIEGDFNLVTVNEVNALAGGNASGRVV